MKITQERIRKKFGTLRRFARLAGLDYWTTYKAVHRGEAEHLQKYFMFTSPYIDPKQISIFDRERLRTFINENYGGSASRFADVEGFSYVTVMQILSGIRKRKTELVRQILLTAKTRTACKVNKR